MNDWNAFKIYVPAAFRTIVKRTKIETNELKYNLLGYALSETLWYNLILYGTLRVSKIFHAKTTKLHLSLFEFLTLSKWLDIATCEILEAETLKAVILRSGPLILAFLIIGSCGTSLGVKKILQFTLQPIIGGWFTIAFMVELHVSWTQK